MIEKYREWEPLEVLQGSPNGAVTHLALYQETMRSYYGASRLPICMPKPLARVGIAMREVLGRMTGHMPFERSWMGEYIDMQLTVDASHTHRRLGWCPNPELEILKIIPFMVHNMLHHSDEWRSGTTSGNRPEAGSINLRLLLWITQSGVIPMMEMSLRGRKAEAIPLVGWRSATSPESAHWPASPPDHTPSRR